MTPPEPLALRLDGCTPTPLASYLKALGILRLLSSPANHVAGKAADPRARGWWENERFHVRTTLSRDALVRFFLEEYAPSPIIAPWNGGSGFYPKDNQDGFAPLAAEKVAKRFDVISLAIRHASHAIRRLNFKERPAGDAKVALVAALRAELPDTALDWLDATLALSGQGLAYPQLLGTGGNDGRLDFTNNFMRRLVSTARPAGLFNASDGSPSAGAASLLRSALFDEPFPGLSSASVGQFAPGAVGDRPNGTTGYAAGAEVNPWDFILMLEGAVAFAGATSRRHESLAQSGASFPFTVRAVGAGWGGVDAADENDARAEFWAPLWARPARFCEIDSLLGEGRAVLNGRTARDAVEFARAASSLGISRGFTEFERFGFLMRAGKAYLAAPLGRRSSVPSSGARLVAELDDGRWLQHLRRVGRTQGEPATAKRAVRQLEDAIFGLLVPTPSADQAQAALAALGRCVEWLTVSEAGRLAVRMPPPLLSSSWVRHADDNSPEFRIAVALAGLGLPPPMPRRRLEPSSSQGGSAARPAAGPSGSSPEDDSRSPAISALPMAAHLAPVDEAGFFDGRGLRRRRAWTKDALPTVVWGAGGLVSNMIAILERRMVETTMRGLQDKPLAGAACAHAEHVAAFLRGDFDDARCAALLRGLVWTSVVQLPNRAGGSYAVGDGLPFAYAVLKPIFSTDAALRRAGILDETTRMPLPPGLLARLRAGGGSLDGRATDQAVRAALMRARGSGLGSPFDRTASHQPVCGRIGAGIRADRLAASLLIPIGEWHLKALFARAYSHAPPDDDSHTEETNHAA